MKGRGRKGVIHIPVDFPPCRKIIPCSDVKWGDYRGTQEWEEMVRQEEVRWALPGVGEVRGTLQW